MIKATDVPNESSDKLSYIFCQKSFYLFNRYRTARNIGFVIRPFKKTKAPKSPQTSKDNTDKHWWVYHINTKTKSVFFLIL